MRREFADELLREMGKNEKIFLLVGDLGYKVFDAHFASFSNRCVNTGAAEQALLDIACGLALDGKIPFVYTITPFFLRGFETIRTYIDYENLPVKLIGAGRNHDYSHDGISHWADDIGLFLNPLQNIKQYWPKSAKVVPEMVRDMVANNKPSFISLER